MGSSRISGALKEWAIRIGFLVVSSSVAVGLAEVAARTFFPIYDGRDNVTRDGKPIKEWFEPGSVYRQVSNEYDALTTITAKGHRVPGVEGNADVIFVGDSFTYGFGLKDDQTFASIYCEARRVACANLGYPGSGTSRQLRRLEQFLERWQWRPKEVKLFFFGMSESFSAGNDFVDNYNYGRWLRSKSNSGRTGVQSSTLQSSALQSSVPRPGLAERAIAWQEPLLEHSTLIRRAKYHWGPLMRSLIVADPGEERMREALHYTRVGLAELDDLSRRYNFDYTVYLIVPVHDIIRGTHPRTLAALNGVSPKPAISTAPLFVDAPQSFYYAYDGHLNPLGSRRVAEFLIDRDSTRSK